MGLEDFLDAQPPVTHFVQEVWNATNPTGLPLDQLRPLGRLVYGRLVPKGSSQFMAWLNTTLPEKIDYKFITLDEDIGNGDYLLTTEEQGSWLFRVTGVHHINWTAGSIPTHWDLDLEVIVRR